MTANLDYLNLHAAAQPARGGAQTANRTGSWLLQLERALLAGGLADGASRQPAPVPAHGPAYPARTGGAIAAPAARGPALSDKDAAQSDAGAAANAAVADAVPPAAAANGPDPGAGDTAVATHGAIDGTDLTRQSGATDGRGGDSPAVDTDANTGVPPDDAAAGVEVHPATVAWLTAAVVAPAGAAVPGTADGATALAPAVAAASAAPSPAAAGLPQTPSPLAAVSQPQAAPVPAVPAMPADSAELPHAAGRGAAAAKQEYKPSEMHMFIDEHGAQAWIRDTRLTPEQALRIARALDGELGAGIRLAALTLNGRKVAGAGRANGGDVAGDKGSNDEYGRAGQAGLPTHIHPRRK